MTPTAELAHLTTVVRSPDPDHELRLYRAECDAPGCGWVSDWTTEQADADEAGDDHREVMANEPDALDGLVSGLLDLQDFLTELVVWLLDHWRANLPAPELRFTDDGLVSLIVRCPDPDVRAEVAELVESTVIGTPLAGYVGSV